MERPERKIAAAGVTRQIIVHPEAEAEVQQAFDWYEEQSKGLGLEFLRAIEACLSGVTRFLLSQLRRWVKALQENLNQPTIINFSSC